MTDDDDYDRKKKSRSRSKSRSKSRSRSPSKDAGGKDESVDDEEKEKRIREERIAASIKKREEEVARELSGHLHAREKEREQHRKTEAISAFQALLTDLIKHPDYSWKEAKKIFKKDSRFVILVRISRVFSHDLD